MYDDIAYGESLGTTAKFPRNAFAFKWADDQKEPTLLEIQWSPSRTGLINPVAVFEPVELEGTSVSRASVHNISIMRSLDLGVGDKILVYKANMIIPQIAENLTRSGVRDIPETCPACGGATRIQMMNNVETLYCTNPECPAKFMKAFTLFVSRDAMNIDGMSEATLEKFVGHGFIREFADIFRLDRYRDEIVEMDGFGEKSYQNLIDSIERDVTKKLRVELVVHYDPVVTDDAELSAVRQRVEGVINAIDPRLSFHDLRMVRGREHTNVIFDLVLPFDLRGEEDAIRRRISEALHAEGHHYRTIITFDSEAFNDIHTRMEADVTEPPVPEEPSGARRE